MAYGITSPDQIIDLNTIKAGCGEFKESLNDFEVCAQAVIEAGDACTKKALSVDDKTFEYPIKDIGEAIKKIKNNYMDYADQVIAQATRVYNSQINEYNEYIARLEREKNNK